MAPALKITLADPMAKGLHVAFPQKLARSLRVEAARRGIRATVLVGAAMQKMVDECLFDAIIDDDLAEDIAPGNVVRINGLTKWQCAVLYLLGLHADAEGIARLAPTVLMSMIPRISRSGIGGVLAALTRRRLIVRAEPDGHGPQPYALTDDGWLVAHELGDFGDGDDPSTGSGQGT